jgi:hypothetical protein
VRTSDPACGSFVDVFIELTDPKSPADPNWAIRGARFGKADREKSQAASATIVERMQSTFRVSEEVKDPATGAQNLKPDITRSAFPWFESY